MTDIRGDISTPEEGYEALAMTLIMEVCKDYRSALVMRDKRMIERCEAFFRSRQFSIYTQGKVDPDYLMDAVRRDLWT